MALSVSVQRLPDPAGDPTLYVVPERWRSVPGLSENLSGAWKDIAKRLQSLPDLAREGVLAPVGQQDWILVVRMDVPEDDQPPTFWAALVVEHGRQAGAKAIVVVPATQVGLGVLALAFGLASYRFTAYKSRTGKPLPTHLILLASTGIQAAKEAVRRGLALVEGVDLARDLVNTPAMDLVPEELADRAAELAVREGLEFTCWYEADLKERDCTGLLAVGKGSAHPPVMIRLDYKPGGPTRKSSSARKRSAKPIHLALIGKGVCFDTGGISIKPAGDMWRMKGDMAGAAAVLGAILIIARLRPAIPVTVLIPSALNAVDAHSVLPGDIIRARNGKTVMVDNTDAEGRLILMDAIYEAGLLGATHCVDIATLTGACSRALGPAVSGLFANDDDLAHRIAQLGNQQGETFWRLPLVEEYVSMLKNDTADLNNIGNAGTAGAITAALFLREFVRPGMKWAHLDIAGTSLPNKARAGLPPGATGVGARTLALLAEILAP
jgi:leucyl aminopeptidase